MQGLIFYKNNPKKHIDFTCEKKADMVKYKGKYKNIQDTREKRIKGENGYEIYV